MMTTIGRVLLSLAAVVAFAFLQLPEAQAAVLCKAPVKPNLDIAAAAAVPVFKGKTKTTIGAAAARAQANAISARRGNICASPVSASVKRSLARIDRLLRNGDRAKALQLWRVTLAEVKEALKSDTRLIRLPRNNVRRAACPDQKAHISVIRPSGVGDNLALAAKAQKLGASAASNQAIGAARAALKAWVQSPANGAKTVGDWIAIATIAQQIGAGTVSSYSLGRARNQAIADVATAAQVDVCTVTRGDFNCWVKMIATAQLLGAPLGGEMKKINEFSKAIQDRLKNKLPQGCEEWTFTMTMTFKMLNNRTDWTIRWAAGKFRVNRQRGIVDGAFRAGFVPDSGWPGIIGSATDDCIERAEGYPDVNHGPGTISSAAFHYKIDGSVSESEIVLSVSSEDATYSMSAPSNVGCQANVGFTKLFIEGNFREGWPAIFAVTADQETATFDFSDADYSWIAQIKRAPLVKP